MTVILLNFLYLIEVGPIKEVVQENDQENEDADPEEEDSADQ